MCFPSVVLLAPLVELPALPPSLPVVPLRFLLWRRMAPLRHS